jgi:hypothetical protein
MDALDRHLSFATELQARVAAMGATQAHLPKALLRQRAVLGRQIGCVVRGAVTAIALEVVTLRPLLRQQVPFRLVECVAHLEALVNSFAELLVYLERLGTVPHDVGIAVSDLLCASAVHAKVLPVVHEAAVVCSTHVLSTAAALASSAIARLDSVALEPANRLARALDAFRRASEGLAGYHDPRMVELCDIRRKGGAARAAVLRTIAAARATALADRMWLADKGKAAPCDLLAQRLAASEEEFLATCFRQCGFFSGVVPTCMGSRLTTGELLAYSFDCKLSEREEFLSVFFHTFAVTYGGLQIEAIAAYPTLNVIQLLERSMARDHAKNPICVQTASLATLVTFHSLAISSGRGLFGLPCDSCPRNWKFQPRATVAGPNDVPAIRQFTAVLEKISAEIPLALHRCDVLAMLETALGMLRQWLTTLRQRHPSDFHTNDLCILYNSLWENLPKITTCLETCPSETVQGELDLLEAVGAEMCEDVVRMARMLTEAAISDTAAKKVKQAPGQPSDFATVILETVLRGASEALNGLWPDVRAELLGRSFVAALQELMQNKTYWKHVTPKLLEADLATFADWAARSETMRPRKPLADDTISKANLVLTELSKLCRPTKKLTPQLIARFTSGALAV